MIGKNTHHNFPDLWLEQLHPSPSNPRAPATGHRHCTRSGDRCSWFSWACVWHHSWCQNTWHGIPHLSCQQTCSTQVCKCCSGCCCALVWTPSCLWKLGTSCPSLPTHCTPFGASPTTPRTWSWPHCQCSWWWWRCQ